MTKDHIVCIHMSAGRIKRYPIFVDWGVSDCIEQQESHGQTLLYAHVDCRVMVFGSSWPFWQPTFPVNFLPHFVSGFSRLFSTLPNHPLLNHLFFPRPFLGVVTLFHSPQRKVNLLMWVFSCVTFTFGYFLSLGRCVSVPFQSFSRPLVWRSACQPASPCPHLFKFKHSLNLSSFIQHLEMTPSYVGFCKVPHWHSVSKLTAGPQSLMQSLLGWEIF